MDVMVGISVARHWELNVTVAVSLAGNGRTASTLVAVNSLTDGGWPFDVGTSSSDWHKTVSLLGSGMANNSSSVDDSVFGSIGSSFMMRAATDGHTPFICTHKSENKIEFTVRTTRNAIGDGWAACISRCVRRPRIPTVKYITIVPFGSVNLEKSPPNAAKR